MEEIGSILGAAMTDERWIEMTVYCPYLACNRPIPHSHGICGSCGIEDLIMAGILEREDS